MVLLEFGSIRKKRVCTRVSMSPRRDRPRESHGRKIARRKVCQLSTLTQADQGSIVVVKQGQPNRWLLISGPLDSMPLVSRDIDEISGTHFQ